MLPLLSFDDFIEQLTKHKKQFITKDTTQEQTNGITSGAK